MFSIKISAYRDSVWWNMSLFCEVSSDDKSSDSDFRFSHYRAVITSGLANANNL